MEWGVRLCERLCVWGAEDVCILQRDCQMVEWVDGPAPEELSRAQTWPFPPLMQCGGTRCAISPRAAQLGWGGHTPASTGGCGLEVLRGGLCRQPKWRLSEPYSRCCRGSALRPPRLDCPYSNLGAQKQGKAGHQCSMRLKLPSS